MKIGRREKCPVNFVGSITGDGKVSDRIFNFFNVRRQKNEKKITITFSLPRQYHAVVPALEISHGPRYVLKNALNDLKRRALNLPPYGP